MNVHHPVSNSDIEQRIYGAYYGKTDVTHDVFKPLCRNKKDVSGSFMFIFI